ncbi:membrane protein insertion efficiency factor YidD [Azospira sp. I13]|uniref:membrane protein insertion efficiency factor YidD n=1 Tax=Azospira sp. I13 TaxID=1765050 RepID=UPI000D595D72
MVLRYAFAGAIVGYQRVLSPRKGFRCAHRVLHGGWSCSEFGRRAVLRLGVLRFFVLQSRRFARCAKSAAILQARPDPEYKEFPWKQCLTNKKVDAAASGCCCCVPFPLP